MKKKKSTRTIALRNDKTSSAGPGEGQADLQGETSGHPLREVGSGSNSITGPREKAAHAPKVPHSEAQLPAAPCLLTPSQLGLTKPAPGGGCDTERKEGGRRRGSEMGGDSPEQVHSAPGQPGSRETYLKPHAASSDSALETRAGSSDPSRAWGPTAGDSHRSSLISWAVLPQGAQGLFGTAHLAQLRP